MKNKILFLLIIILAFCLRFYKLSSFPVGFYSDEAAFSYNSFSLLKTFHDEFGVFAPVALKSFGDYKAAFLAYFLIPFIFVGNLTVFTVRSGSALLGIIQIILVYLITFELFKSRKLALLGSFIMSVTPLALQFNRMVHENNLSAVLIAATVYFFIKARKRILLLFPAVISASLSFYAYHDARVLTPLILLFFVFYLSAKLLNNFKVTLLCLFIGLIMLIPLLRVMQSKESWNRMQNTSITTDYGMVLTVNKERGESGNNWLSKILHNKLTVIGRQFLENYNKHFDLTYLFFTGDPVQIYSTAGNGVLLLIFLPFLILGIVDLFSFNGGGSLLVFYWLLVSPVAGALTRFTPSASRTFPVIFPLAIIISAGIFKYVSIFRKNSILMLLLCLLMTVNFAYYLHYYYVNTSVRFAKEWHYGMSQVIAKVSNRQKNYEHILFSQKAWGYIYPLFFLKYPPSSFQLQARLGPLDIYGFGWIEGFDKYEFGVIPKYFDYGKKTLYVVAPEDIKFKPEGVNQVKYPDGSDAFYLLDTSEISKLCSIKCSLKEKPLNENIYGQLITK